MEIVTRPKATIIIPVTYIPFYNYLEILEKNMEMLEKHNDFEVIIIDNINFTQKAKNLFEKYKKSGHKIILYQFKFSYPKIFNYASKFASGEYLIFLDGTAILKEGMIAKLLNIFDNDKTIGVLSPKIIEKNIHNIETIFFRIIYRILMPLKNLYNKLKIKPKTFKNGIGMFKFILSYIFLKIFELETTNTGFLIKNKIIKISKVNNKTSTVNRNAVSSVCFVTKKDIFMELNGFDEKYNNFFYDLDFCLKAKRKYKIIVDMETSVRYIEGLSIGIFRYNTFPKNYDREIFFDKWLKKQEKKIKEKNILVVKLMTMGDAIMVTPILKALKNKYQDYKITVLSIKPWSEVFESNPYIDELISFCEDKIPALPDYVIYDFLTAKFLKNKKWDYIFQLNCLDFHPEYRRTGLHLREFYASMAGVYPLEDKRYYIVIDDIIRKKIKTILENLKLDNKKLMAIHINGGWELKNWRKDKWCKLAEIMDKKYGFKTILIGGKDEYLNSNYITNLAGKLSIKELAGLYERCELFVGLDSGPMHLACAVNIPVIALFGVTHTKVGEPNCDNYIAIQSQDSCEIPCGLKHCYKKINCTSMIEIDTVIKAVDILLTKKNIKEIWLGDKPADVFFKDWEWHTVLRI